MESHNSLIRTLETKVNALVFLNSELRKQTFHLQKENNELRGLMDEMARSPKAGREQKDPGPSRLVLESEKEDLAGLKEEITGILTVIDRCLEGLNHEKNE